MRDFFNLQVDSLKQLQIVDWAYTEELNASSFNKFDVWTKKEENQSLQYLLDRRKTLRESIKLINSEAQSVVVFLFSYAETKKQMQEERKEKIASYTLGFEGLDYHYVLRERLDLLLKEIQKAHHSIDGVFSLDIEPVLERDLAYRAGLGWFGKNSMLIHKTEGSYFIIGSIILNQKLNLPLIDVDVDHCGTCNACVEACPTDAIDPSTRTISLSKCISTYTIEVFKDTAPPKENISSDKIFGCDICQDVCPWNKKKLATTSFVDLSNKAQDILDFWHRPMNSLLENISKFTNKTYVKFWHQTSFERSGKKGMLKNIKWRLSEKGANKS